MSHSYVQKGEKVKLVLIMTSLKLSYIRKPGG